VTEFSVHESLLRNYDAYYDGKSEWRRLGALDKARNIQSLCADIRHRKVLEIGAGEGSILQVLSDEGFAESLYALEISESAVRVIRERNLAALQECRLFDGYAVPYGDKEFDLVILSHVLEHLEYPRRLLYEAARVAHHVFIEVPLEDTSRQKADFVFDAVGHINDFSMRSIRRFVQSCRMRVISQRTTNNSLPVYIFQFGKCGGLARYVIKRTLLRLVPGLASRVYTYNSSLLCRSC
jgi:ubiquinone/menaquinone biosynthesis C-methylase UbiE